MLRSGAKEGGRQLLRYAKQWTPSSATVLDVERGLKEARQNQRISRDELLQTSRRLLVDKCHGPGRDLQTSDERFVPEEYEPEPANATERLALWRSSWGYNAAMAHRVLGEALELWRGDAEGGFAEPLRVSDESATGANYVALAELMREEHLAGQPWEYRLENSDDRIFADHVLPRLRASAENQRFSGNEEKESRSPHIALLSPLSDLMPESGEERHWRPVVDAMLARGPAMLAIADQGSKARFARLMAVRAYLLHTRGWRLLAPCAHSMACPHAHCKFKQNYQRTEFLRDVLPGKRDIAVQRYNYLIFASPHALQERPALAASGGGARVVEPLPEKAKGHVKLWLCTREGTVARTVFTKQRAKAADDGSADAYKQARKAAVGDVFAG